MLNKETVLTLFEETSQVFVYNLDFIPEDKLDWKPAPEAKSVLEVVNHLAEFLDTISRSLGLSDSVFVAATDRDEAKQVLSQACQRYATAVRDASPATLSKKFRDDMPFTVGWMVTASTLDTIHHAGQIAYIQTLLGDNEIHFDESALPDWAVG
jgi:hypothetical protein